MKIHEYNQMMSYLTRPAAPKTIPVAREILSKGTKPEVKKVEKKIAKVANKKNGKYTPPPIPKDSLDWDLWLRERPDYKTLEEEYLQESSLGNVEQDLADEYWHGLYDDYLNNGGTLGFSDWLKIELDKSSKADGIKSILRI
jgi:hypothetical protein